MTRGLYRDPIWRAKERVVAWVVIAGAAADETAFKEFHASLRASKIGFDATVRTLRASLPSGEYALEHDGPFVRDGVERTFGPLSSTPHASIDGAPMRPWNDPA